MKVREYIAKLQDELANEYHLKMKDITYGNGYFLFDLGEDGVVEFKIRGCKGWLFRIWFYFKEDSDDIEKLVCFCRHKDDTDKFKPTRSVIKEEFEDEELLEFSYAEIAEMILYVKRHHWVAYLQSYFDTMIVREGYFSYLKLLFSIKKYNFKRYYFDCFKYNINYFINKLDFMRIKMAFKNTNACSIDFIDRNIEYPEFVCSPRYDIDVKVDEDFDDSNINYFFYYRAMFEYFW